MTSTLLPREITKAGALKAGLWVHGVVVRARVRDNVTKGHWTYPWSSLFGAKAATGKGKGAKGKGANAKGGKDTERHGYEVHI